MNAPRLSSSVILLRPTAGEPELYLTRRNVKMAFMGGAFVFPGGVLDEADFTVPGPEFPIDAVSPRPGLGRALRVTAARETFEEAGVYLGAGLPDAAERARVHEDPARFVALTQVAPLYLDQLLYFSHWITPSGGRRRFDTHFFLARLPEGQDASPDGGEAVEGRWMTPSAALAAHAQAELLLSPPTHRLVELSAGHGDLEAVWRFWEAAKIAPICPKRMRREDGAYAVLPWHPSYPELEGEGEVVAPGSEREAALPSELFIAPARLAEAAREPLQVMAAAAIALRHAADVPPRATLSRAEVGRPGRVLVADAARGLERLGLRAAAAALQLVADLFELAGRRPVAAPLEGADGALPLAPGPLVPWGCTQIAAGHRQRGPAQARLLRAGLGRRGEAEQGQAEDQAAHLADFANLGRRRPAAAFSPLRRLRFGGQLRARWSPHCICMTPNAARSAR